MDKDIERVHYLNSPFTARFIRFHPVDWHRHISMRAGLIGCQYTGIVRVEHHELAGAAKELLHTVV